MGQELIYLLNLSSIYGESKLFIISMKQNTQKVMLLASFLVPARNSESIRDLLNDTFYKVFLTPNLRYLRKNLGLTTVNLIIIMDLFVHL